MPVIDASVFVKALTEEAGSEAALGAIAAAQERIAPDLLELEVASALSKKVRNAALASDQALASMAALGEFVDELHPSSDLIGRALALSLAIGHAVYDCLYLALAERLDCTLLTADGKFVENARRAGHGQRIEQLIYG